MTWTDITNHYVVAGVEQGLLGVIAVCGMLATGLWMMIRLYRSTQDAVLRSWYWALGSTIVTLAIIFNGVLFSGQAGTIFYCILGFTGSSYNIAMRNQFSRERPCAKVGSFSPKYVVHPSLSF
jgi:hypothetical protein